MHLSATRELGDARVRARSSVELIVPPSAGTPPSFNVLIDPDPPHAPSIEIERKTPFVFDARPGAERS